MNANCYKIIFSKRLGTLVAVGEHATSAGKQASGQGTRHTLAAVALACMTIGCAQAQSTLNASALPTSSQVNTGKVTVGTHGAIMTINQASDKASINWNSFNIGSNASVSINQPNASAVLLNRVIGNDPSQIFGKLNANGQVILLNPNGIVFGQTGSVTASAFTASTFGLSDDDFMSGYYKYNRNGSTASVVNQGTIETTSGGYVALIGATVTNDGKIIAPQGDVVLAAAESVTLPEALVKAQAPATPNTISVRMSKRVRLELDPATVNTAVNNTANGVIVTEGGQVLLQAAAIQAAVASVTHSGQIDTSSAQQAGAVTVLAEHGSIKVDGSIKANSSGNDGQNQTRRGGDIVIGRDEETGALAKATDVSGAKLESQGGFIETSGNYLKADEIKVKAAEWLLDPTNISIEAAGTTPSGTAYSTNYTAGTDSVILASNISDSLTAGTSVTIATSASGASSGNISVNASIAKTGGIDATLTLKAHGDINIAANKTITSNTGKLNVILNSDLDGSGSGAIKMATGSAITSNGGNVTLGGGTAGTGTGAAIGSSAATFGISLDGASITTGIGNVSLNGTSYTTGSSLWGVNMDNGATITTSSGNVNITATGQSNGAFGYGMLIQGINTKVSTGTGNITVNATSTASGTSDAVGIQIRSTGAFTTGGGNISLTGTSRGVAGSGNLGIDFHGGSLVAGGNGTITVSGTGTNGCGICSNAIITTAGGAINITGATTSPAIDFVATGSSINTSGGNITFNVNSYSGGTTENINAGSGTVTIQNRTAGTLINLGGTDSSGTLGISNAELGRITASTTKIGSTNAGNLTVSSAITTTASVGNLYLQTNGTATVNTSSAIASGAGLFIQTTGGNITTNSAISGTNIALDNSNGLITTATGSIANGLSAGSTGIDGIDLGANVTASGNLNMYGLTTNWTGIKVKANVTLSGGKIQATGKTGATFGLYFDTGSSVTTTGNTGASLLTGYAAAATPPISTDAGYGAVDFYGTTLTAATGTTLSIIGNATGSAASDYGNTRGMRVQGAVNTYGSINLTGNSSSDDGLLIAAGSGINIMTGSLSLNGTMTANGAIAGLTGVNVSAPITLNNNTTLSITGNTSNQIGASLGFSEIGAAIYSTIGQAAGQTTAGNISITGYSNSYSNSNGVKLTQAVSTGTGNISIIGQNFEGGGGTGVTVNANMTSTSGDIIIQSIGGNIKQSSASTLSGKNVTIDNTGAGLTSLMADSSYSAIYTLAVGTSMGGSIDSATGAITTGIGVRSDSAATDAINLAGAINATGNINIQGNTYKTTNIGINLAGGATPTIKTSGVSASININSNSSITDNTKIQGTNGANISLIAERDLLIQQAITTANTSATAVVLESGKSATAGTSTGGDIKITGNGSTTAGTGGRITYLTGSVTGSTLTGVTTGNYRYFSDESSTNYSAALGSGTYAIYREKPLITVQVNNGYKNYDGNAFTGGTLTLASGSAMVNSDTLASATANAVYGGTAQGAIDASPTPYVISASDSSVSPGRNALGYGVTYQSGSYTIAAKEVTLVAAKTYNGSYALTGNQLTISTGVGTETLGYSSATIYSKDVGNNSTNYVDAVALIDGLNGGKASNYTFTAARSAKNTVSLSAKEVTLSALKDYDGGMTLSGNQLLITTGVGTETLTYSGATIHSKNVADNTTNYVDAITLGNGTNGGLSGNYTFTAARGVTNTVSLNAKQVGLSASKEYDGITTLTGSQLTITTGVGTETLTYSGATLHSKNVADNTTNYVDAVTLLNGNNGGIGSNYTFTAAPTANNTVALSKAALTLTANSDTTSKIYNGTEQSVSGFTITSGSLKGSDSVADLAGITAGGKGTNAATYVTSVNDTAYTNGNYAITKVDGSLVIAKKEVVLSAAKEYDGVTTLSGNQLSIATGVGSETLSYSNASIHSKNVADNATNYVDAVTLADGTNGGLASNYKLPNLTSATAGKNTVAISAAALTLTANSDTTSKIYNGTEQSVSGFTITSGSLKGTDSASAVLTGITAGGKGTDAGTYASTVDDSTYTNTNYALHKVAGSLVIAQKEVALSAAKEYDGSKALSGTQLRIATGVGSETLTYSNASIHSKNVADNITNYVDAVTLLDGTHDGKASNYKFTPVPSANNTVTLSEAALTLTANSGNKIYNGSEQSITGFTITNGSLKGTDTITVDLAAISAGGKGTNSGAYTTAVNDSAYTHGNYVITKVAGSLVIAPKEVVLAANKTFDGNNTLTGSQLSIATGIGAETLLFSNASLHSSQVSDNASNYVESLTLLDGSNGGKASNYTFKAARSSNNTAVLNSQQAPESGKESNKKPQQPFVHPTQPVLPNKTDSASNGDSNSAGNPYIVIPKPRSENNLKCELNTTPSRAALLAAEGLDGCLCETQYSRGIDGLAICYEPKKTADNQPVRRSKI